MAARALFASLGVFCALFALLGAFGITVCCGISFEAGVASFDAGVAADGVGEVCARGGGADGGGDVLG